MASKLFNPNKLSFSVFGAIQCRGQSSAAKADRKYQIELDLPHPFQFHKLSEGPKSKGIILTRNEALHYYRNMLTVRRIETCAGNMYTEKKVRGFCHESVGQEASPVGIASTLERSDAVITLRFQWSRGLGGGLGF